MMMNPQPIIVAYGDGIGPEIMEAALLLLREVRAPITVATTEMGAHAYKMEYRSGILPSIGGMLLRSRVILKAPTIAPEALPELHLPTMEGAPVSRFIPVTDALCEMLELDRHYCARFGLHPDAVQDGCAIAHVNDQYAVFEPMHGAEPEKAGENNANPCGMIMAMSMMLEHMGLEEYSRRIETATNALQREGIFPPGMGQKAADIQYGTREWAEAVMEKLASASFSEQNSTAFH